MPLRHQTLKHYHYVLHWHTSSNYVFHTVNDSSYLGNFSALNNHTVEHVVTHVTKERISFLSEKSAFNIEFENPKINGFSAGGFTAVRAKFDKWISEKAEEAGATLITGIKIDNVIREDGIVKGIQAGSDKIYSDVVIAADGITSQIAKDLGLRGDWNPNQIAVGIKETIQLPKNVINDRFNLLDEEGMANVFVGDLTEGIMGGGFLYTNKENISLGIVVRSDDLTKRKVHIDTLLQRFKSHPTVHKLIKEGKTQEYSTHMIPDAGVSMMPKLYDNGIMLEDNFPMRMKNINMNYLFLI